VLVTFETKAFGNITMFCNVAITLPKCMSHSGTVPSAIKAEDIPVALERLKKAVAADRAASDAKPTHAQDDQEDKDGVSLALRAYPLIQLLEAAVKADGDVMWRS